MQGSVAVIVPTYNRAYLALHTCGGGECDTPVGGVTGG